MKRSGKTIILTLSFTFVIMSLLVIFTSRVIFKTIYSSVQELGDNKTSAVSADLENYLDTAKSVLWLTADTVDHMVEKGAGYDEIVEYITRESQRTERQFDESYTGIYGYINGKYVDGVGWVPPADYDPTTRDWYKTCISAKGEVVIVSPYVDAQTGNVIISVGRALTDVNNALALDLTLSEVQEIVEKIQINGYGYGFIMNNDGMIIAHASKDKNGKYFYEQPDKKDLYDKIVNTGKGNFRTTIDGEKCTVFVDTVMDQWNLVIVTKDSELYKSPNALLLLSILINLIVFLLISAFYIISYRSECKSNARMEEMKEIERQKDYEAKILKLEKSAADSANKAKSDFLADMSHEIRTPINAILGMNEMILHESKEPGTIDYAANIKTAGNTLLSIINTILDFSKIEDGRMHLVPAAFDTSELITGLYNSINERARSKNLELKLDIDETIPAKLIGDDVRISQVIMNLLTNAVKYTEKGSILFTMKNLGEENGHLKLYVSVKDTGIGIREEDISKLSISFERVDEKKNRHIEGTGLGISIVTKLLNMMDSKLMVKSTYGAGSDFYFELPLSVADHTPIGKYQPEHKIEGNISSNVGFTAPAARILITDDNEMNLKVANNLLKLFNITPDLCASGSETIELMKKNRYDILFLDHMMPKMDGIETLKALKDASLTGDTRIIALTANAVVGAREQYLDAGFDSYLSKPINISDLESMLKKYLPEKLIVYGSGEADDAASGDAMDVKKSDSPSDKADLKKDDAAETDEFRMDFDADSDCQPASNSDRIEGIAAFTAIGLKTNDALIYCGGDEAFYLELLNDYSSSAEDKISKLEDFLAEGDLKAYKILIHSIKSTSKTIGSMEMYESALSLENAAAEGRLDYIESNHSKTIDELRSLSKKITEILKQN